LKAMTLHKSNLYIKYHYTMLSS